MANSLSDLDLSIIRDDLTVIILALQTTVLNPFGEKPLTKKDAQIALEHTLNIKKLINKNMGPDIYNMQDR